MNEVLAGIDVFVAVVDSGSFSAAAGRRGLTRSAVAKTVARLEARLQLRLFHRTTRSQTLTEDGQLYYQHCLRALDELRVARTALDSGRHAAVGRLRVTAPLLFGRRCVAPILAELVAHHPRLTIDVHFSDAVVDVLADGYDLAIRNGAPGAFQGTGLTTRTLGQQRMVICAAPAYLATHGTPADLDDLKHHAAIVYAVDGGVKPWEFPQVDGPPLTATPPSRLRFDDVEAIADAATAGHGLAWLPCWLIRERVNAGALVPLLKALPARIFSTQALWPTGPHMPLKLRVALDALAAGLPGSAEL